MNIHKILLLSSSVGITALVGCASVPPQELVDARNAYTRASMGSASQVAPAELHKAKEALEDAEAAFKDDEDSQETRDLAYVAERKAQLADALAQQKLAEQKKAQAEKEFNKGMVQVHKQTKEELERTRRQLEEQTKKSQETLSKLAAVKEDQRGLVVTLSGSVLFPSNQATLLPEAQARLSQVSEALMSTKDRTLVIQGHTDSRGPEDYNEELSQRRANAVRDYLVSRGYDPNKIQTQGAGEANPIASNASAEGRANNRRVEIVIQNPESSGSATR